MSEPDREVLDRLPRWLRGRVVRLDCPDLARQLTRPVPALGGRSFIEAGAGADTDPEPVLRVLGRWEEIFGTRE